MAGVTGSIPVAPTIAHPNPLSNFFSLYSHDFVRVACCVPRTRVADAAYNLAETLRLAAIGDKARTAIMVFPELGLSSYAIEDLLLQDALLDPRLSAHRHGRRGLRSRLAPCWSSARRCGGTGGSTTARSWSIAASCWASCPRSYLPNYREFYERRHFASGEGTEGGTITIGGQTAPFGPDQLFAAEDFPDLVVHAEICEDFWVPVPPSSKAALAGATVLVNLSASNIVIGKAQMRRLLCASQSARCIAAYAYTAAGRRRIDHRPRLGRPGRDLRERRPPGRDRSASLEAH